MRDGRAAASVIGPRANPQPGCIGASSKPEPWPTLAASGRLNLCVSPAPRHPHHLCDGFPTEVEEDDALLVRWLRPQSPLGVLQDGAEINGRDQLTCFLLKIGGSSEEPSYKVQLPTILVEILQEE